jgi:signal transduction histidine kinase
MSRSPSAKEFETLLRLSSIVNSSLDITEVLTSAMGFVEELLDAEASTIFEVDETTNELFFRVVRGEGAYKAKEIRLKMGEGVVGWVASSGESVIVPDAQKDKRFSSEVDSITGFETRSIIASPIKNKGRLIGALEVLNKKGAKPFDHESLEVLTLIVNQIGIAMVNAKLYERLQGKFLLTQSELKKTQEQLLRSERLAALGQFSMGVAHEVRNPVMSIGGFARRLKKRLERDDTAVAYADIILKETGRLEKMVEDIERYTSMPEPVTQPVKLSALFQTVLNIWEEEHREGKARIKLQTLPENPTIFLDEEQMANALIKLMHNSASAMPNGGTITISNCWEGNCLVISVKDNGAGIDPEVLPRIFDPFFTTKTQGSGLGLTTVNRIVSNHGGQVKVSTDLGAGTEVKLCIPR